MRWVAFTGAPTRAECYRSLATRDGAQPVRSAARWRVLSNGSPSQETAVLRAQSISSTQAVEAALLGTVAEPHEGGCKTFLEAGFDSQDMHVLGEEDIDYLEQSLAIAQAAPPASASDETQDASRTADTQAGTESRAQGIFGIDLFMIIPLKRAHEMLKQHGQFGASISILAAIIEVTELRELSTKRGTNKLVTVEVWDESGSTLRIAAWGDVAQHWRNTVRRGDVVHVNNIRLCMYLGKPQGTARYDSLLTICYRTRYAGSQDDQYRPDLELPWRHEPTLRVRRLVELVS
ncbi:uncharacterized protein L969DRAFT_47002 [Mixia osmundae IAM 14324]|uniref:Shieldin complex subunit 2 first OB fold domain-containing protein n=1 Tax=Mixia osmundae (strain CBS 9802 / IAM 14324 / JCM 22182 / KY 12970) TaxID=764103 RepID=G7E5N3_MIXOS|nr:uncharacterized protein L969DRAFT_47002 [Mixia osmundae IAM 14324]KEI40708.1 hypothetical protein L969DRAFT_47002 [Mixia osmundae IAM 14324]GAA98143.1 hypothetical protein E5Q_04826 [Mixia osmundae IAM 14324]